MSATMIPTIRRTVSTLTEALMREQASASVPEILLVCTPLMPMAANTQKTAAK